MSTNRISSITIENFKGIGAEATVPLKPITLLFGANSTGKSTILQAMHYAREVFENRNPDPDKTMLGGDSIDLGGFRNLVNQRDLGKRIRIRFELKVDHESLFERRPDIDIRGYFKTESSIKIEHLWVEFVTGWTDKGAEILEYSVGINNDIIGTISCVTGKSYITALNLKHSLFYNFQDTVEDILLEVIKINQDVMDPIEVHRQTSAIPEYGKSFSVNYAQTENEIDGLYDDGGVKDGDQFNISMSKHLINQFWYIMSFLFILPGELILEELRGLRYLGPIREVPPRNYIIPKTPNESRWANGLGAWDVLARNMSSVSDSEKQSYSLFKKCNEYFKRLNLGYHLREFKIIQLPAGKDFRADLGVLASRFEDFDDISSFAKGFDNYMNQFPSTSFPKLYDENNGLDVEPYDVGIGIAEVLPVIVGAADSNCTMFAIEQPELHIHPAIQCRLGDIFLIEGASGDTGRMFLLETHSEHLVLRIMRRMRETVEKKLPEGFPEITPDIISILLVENIDGQTIIREMPLNERGELVKAWPGGFFEEGLQETL